MTKDRLAALKAVSICLQIAFSSVIISHLSTSGTINSHTLILAYLVFSLGFRVSVAYSFKESDISIDRKAFS